MDTDKKYKIRVISNGTLFTYSDCSILPEPDNSFLKFKDKYGIIFIYNKTAINSMEELK